MNRSTSGRDKPRIAVVLTNLGGPDSPGAVQPFLFNLFNDPAIVGLPGMVRTPLARLIARRRAPTARDIYARMDGRSPIVPLTERQAAALEKALAGDDGGEMRVFIAMRYWHPRAEETVRAVKEFAPHAVVLLPLYPQFSTTTTASSSREWKRESQRAGLTAPLSEICCYPLENHFLDAHVQLLKEALDKRGAEPGRVLFSAHGLPERTVTRRGDPYPWQVEQGCAAIAGRLGLEDWAVCYQSRVGPLKWIGPSTEEEIRRAGQEGKGVVLTPIAFVSEHSETLVELDIEYRHLAEASGVPWYVRVPALGESPEFIAGLAALVRRALNTPGGVLSHEGGRICPAEARGCPNFRKGAGTETGLKKRGTGA
ncbi:MAG: ferrochelatase [Alphaproteobacteria bacterium]